jgi:hypothetical protein
MESYKNRVVEEKRELDAKWQKLVLFMTKDDFKNLPDDERNRLSRQEMAMGMYSEILGERIEAFSK